MKSSAIWLGVILLMASLPVGAQMAATQTEIDRDVWRPFIASFNARDDEAFAAVHSKEVARVLRDGDLILDYDSYFRPLPDSIRSAWDVWKRDLQLRFIERIASGEQAFEIGYYRTESVHETSGERQVHYGKFHVLLRKEGGKWRILMDADGAEGVDEQVFLTGSKVGEWGGGRE